MTLPEMMKAVFEPRDKRRMTLEEAQDFIEYTKDFLEEMNFPPKDEMDEMTGWIEREYYE